MSLVSSIVTSNQVRHLAAAGQALELPMFLLTAVMASAPSLAVLISLVSQAASFGPTGLVGFLMSVQQLMPVVDASHVCCLLHMCVVVSCAENVMLRSSADSPMGYVCKLCDFGLVKLLARDR